MNKIYVILLLAVSLVACGQQGKENKSGENGEGALATTTYYFIRHAEKDLSDAENRDPKLTVEGEERAQEWKDYFDDKEIDVVYSTNYERTMNTALPTANAKGLLISNYDPAALYDMEFAEATEGKNVLVVGHSNTTPFFVNKVIGKDTYTDIDESEYGHLYTVTVTNGEAVVQHKEFN